MKVLFLDTVHPLLERRLVNMGFNCEYDYSSNRTSILKNISVYDGIIIRSRIKIDFEFLSAAKKLKFIARSGAGLENIDCKEAEKRGVTLFSAPEGNRQAVGEHAVGMILCLFKSGSNNKSECPEFSNFGRIILKYSLTEYVGITDLLIDS